MTAITEAIRSSDAAGADDRSPVLLLLHGFGSHERDLVGLVPHVGWGRRWASLRAPVPAGAGAAWFPITRPGNPDAAPVEAATDAIWAWVDANLGADTPVVPLGFSQGGLMASQLLRSRPERVPAAVVLGGFVLGHPQPGDTALRDAAKPVFWGRGADDLVIAPGAVDRTAEFLPEHSALQARVYPGLAHGIDAAELADVREFLAAVPELQSQDA
ncbi:alpha/beta hydrolase [Demequina zhanjiangensis]|uniref:Dienelactone hydrolase family protein n=1 Tax=Demequina zhanjiangensis TaxID=3051659 RepID=A0ABT8G1K2_9MICO|nr:dienelactone hydrolase family protein [Demequina sp. SYSU T00b26]MDN4473020.1 dienelactone hydrolase family protein [Demequina sp. SYSU T00b26]